MVFSSNSRPSGQLGLQVIKPMPDQLSLWQLIKLANPLAVQGPARRWRFKQLRRIVPQLIHMAAIKGGVGALRAVFGAQVAVIYSSLVLQVKRADGSIEQLGLASLKLVTDLGVAAIVDGLDSGTMAAFDFQGVGTGTTGAAQTDTDIETEITTEYNTNSTRPTGTISQPTAPVFRNLAVIGVDASVAATEVGILDNATVGSGTLLDRHTFTVVNLVSGDSLQATYDLTIAAGG